jgi:3-methyladenine DNA glycosylase AlkC
MPEPFKNFINQALVQAAGAQLQLHASSFDTKEFCARICPHLDALELKARAMLIADVLEQMLPEDFDAAARMIEHALAPVDAGEASAFTSSEQGLRGWILWPIGEFAARRGIDHPERALVLLHAVTQRFTAEFAIRPILVAHPKVVYDTLGQWVRDPSDHVRRLVSEGTRPRLPWGLQLKALIADPSPSWPLLEALLDDPSEYVRRSVANHLNDIAKDHPELVVDWIERHLPGASTERRALLRHASRTLIKQGHRRTLHLWGLGKTLKGTVQLTLAPKRIRLGESLTVTVSIDSTARSRQQLAIDYIVHHQRSNGTTSPKVFKGWVVDLAAKASVTLNKRHALRLITTRRYYPGLHRVDVQINGVVVATASFSLAV